jgi:hypothetical protein
MSSKKAYYQVLMKKGKLEDWCIARAHVKWYSPFGNFKRARYGITI